QTCPFPFLDDPPPNPLPRPPGITEMEPGSHRPASSKPDVGVGCADGPDGLRHGSLLSLERIARRRPMIQPRRQNRDTAIRRRKCPLALNRRRKLARRNRMPYLSVIRQQNFKMQLPGIIENGIAHYNAVCRIPESDRIKKCFRVGVRELQC